MPLVGFFGTLNSTDGGHSQRYSMQSEWHRQGINQFEFMLFRISRALKMIFTDYPSRED